MANSKIVNHNGYPAISIDGKIYPPMTATITTSRIAYGSLERTVDKEYYRELGKAGIKIYYLMCNNCELEENSVDVFYEEASAVLDAVPDAYIMVRMVLNPSEKWMKENPDEIVQYSDGIEIPTTMWTEAYVTHHNGMYSLCSQKWRTDMSESIIKTIDKIRTLPCADRIAGIFLGAGGTSEWYYINPIENLNTDSYADLSPSFKRHFTEYLNNKYGEGVKECEIPNAKLRYYTEEIDRDIASPGRVLAGQPAPKGPQKEGHFGSFLDIDSHPEVFDFYRAWHEGTADSIIHFASVIRENYPEYLIGSFYGSMGGSEIVWASNCAAALKILDSGKVDFLANPGVYENRQPGGFEGQRQCPDSFRLRNTMFIVEDDTRTHAENTYFGEMVEMFGMEDTLNVLKRDFGRNICEDLQSWWFDQHIGGGRYKYPEVYKIFARQSEIADLAYSLPREKGNEIAFIYDEESIHTASKQSSDECVQQIRNYEIANIGAGVDSYFHNDMSNPDMPDYKLYVFCNCFYLSDKEREDIKNKLKKTNAVALFLYGNGIINPDREKKLDISHICDLTGIECSMLYEKHSPMFNVIEGSHQIADGLDPDKIFGAFLRQRKGNVGFIPLAMPRSYLYPLIYANDKDATVFANFSKNKLPASCVKEVDGYTSVYCGAKYISADFIREVARFAGCHIYEEDGHVFHASNNFITVHGAKSGKVTLNLKGKCTPYELYEEKNYGENTDEISFDIRKGETKMFYLKNKKEP